MDERERRRLEQKRKLLTGQMARIEEFLRGSVVLMKRPCTYPKCRKCASGERHPTWGLTVSEKGKTRTVYLGAKRLDAARRMTENYRRLQALIEQISKHHPAIHAGLREVTAHFHDAASSDAVLERFSLLPKISVDYAIMERADRVAVVEMDCEWLDVGSWSSLAEIYEPDEANNIQAAPNVVMLEGSGNIFVSESDHLIATIGVEDLIVVHADDATVICRKQDAQRIKNMVAKVKAATGERYM